MIPHSVTFARFHVDCYFLSILQHLTEITVTVYTWLENRTFAPNNATVKHSKIENVTVYDCESDSLYFQSETVTIDKLLLYTGQLPDFGKKQ